MEYLGSGEISKCRIIISLSIYLLLCLLCVSLGSLFFSVLLVKGLLQDHGLTECVCFCVFMSTPT
jgi:hypothetical protein